MVSYTFIPSSNLVYTGIKKSMKHANVILSYMTMMGMRARQMGYRANKSETKLV